MDLTEKEQNKYYFVHADDINTVITIKTVRNRGKDRKKYYFSNVMGEKAIRYAMEINKLIPNEVYME